MMQNRHQSDYKKDEYFGSPYDVGNYASHYDQSNNYPGNQPIGSASETSLSGRMDHSGKGPRGYHRSDKRILEDVNDHLYLDPYLDASDIEVHVNKSEVILNGTVEDLQSKRRAEDIAESVAGVTNVENKIRLTKTHISGPLRSSAGEELK